MKPQIEKIIKCPYCSHENKITVNTIEEFKEIIYCEKCEERFKVYFNYKYEKPICGNGCSKGFVFIKKKLVITDDGWKTEGKKVLKNGKLADKIYEYREYDVSRLDYIECLECKEKWDGMFDEKGRVL